MAFGLTLTESGSAEISAAYQAGEVVTITSVLLGDGGGAVLPSTPDELAALTELYGKFGSEPFSSGSVGEEFINGQVIIDCKTYPGKTLREVGLQSSSGTLIAYGVYPDSYLPAQTDSVIKEIIINLVLVLTHSSSVTLEVDPYIAVLTEAAGDARYLQIAKNLSDLDDVEKARDNLDLGDSATRDVGKTTGTVAAGDDSRITGALQSEKKLLEIAEAGAASQAEARNNLGLGDSATRDVGKTTGTVAAGDDSRITGALQSEKKLLEIAEAGVASQAEARKNLGISDPESSLSENGSFGFPGGVQFKWGKSQLAAGLEHITVTFPEEFDSECYGVQLTVLGKYDTDIVATAFIKNFDKKSFTCVIDGFGTVNFAYVLWLAVGK
ncbi:phage tail-collar fiber domain-containing protein [Klebsiella pneumoniae]